MIWFGIIILAAVLSIGDGKIAPSHWAFPCYAVVVVKQDRIVFLGENADGSVNGYVLADTDCR